MKMWRRGALLGATALTAFAALPAANAQVINELLANDAGGDELEFIEIFGTPNAALTDLSVIVIEGDSGSSSLGNITARFDLGSFALDGNGFFVLGDTDGLQGTFGLTPGLDFQSGALQNGSQTYALVPTSSLNGPATLPDVSDVVDVIATNDGGGADQAFLGAPVVLNNSGGVFRSPNGVDTDAAADFVAVDDSEVDAGMPGPFTPGASNPDPVVADPVVVQIFDIQGAGHVSPFVDMLVQTKGVVTAIAFNGFFFQDPLGDSLDETSDGLFAFTNSAPSVSVGDSVIVTGMISEFVPGGFNTGNLSTTQITPDTIETVATSSPLPAPTVIGRGGRIPPAVDVISEDELPGGDVSALPVDPADFTEADFIDLRDPDDDLANLFDPAFDGIDFFESLEGMLVLIDDPNAVSATRTFNFFSSEFFTVPNRGLDVVPAEAITSRGALLLQPDPNNRGDQNPERVQVQIDGTIFPGSVPDVTVHDELGDILGVVGYSFGNFEVNAIQPFTIRRNLLPESRSRLARSPSLMTFVSYNVLNLTSSMAVESNVTDPDGAQRMEIANQIVSNLRSPDVIALQEIQDNNGVAGTNDGIVAADQTLTDLAQAIASVGGPNYSFLDFPPAEGTSGGVPGGNIRVAYLFDPRRINLTGFRSLTQMQLTAMGVSDPMAFLDTRDPLIADFRTSNALGAEEFTVINVHLSSRSGSTPIFGGPQPFMQGAENARESQVTVLNEVVDMLLANDPDRRIIVAGDFNTFQFTNDLTDLLPGDPPVLFNAIDNLTNPENDGNQYTFNFNGNSQVLDHIFVTSNLLPVSEVDIAHVNVDFPRTNDPVASDHEPVVLRFRLDSTSTSAVAQANP